MKKASSALNNLFSCAMVFNIILDLVIERYCMQIERHPEMLVAHAL